MDSRKKPFKWGFAIFVVILLMGIWARFYHLGEKSLWSDEIATIASTYGHSIDPDAYRLRHESFDFAVPALAKAYLAKAFLPTEHPNLASTAEVLKWNVHPPLFFMGMQPWVGWQGISPESLRFPAVLFGILSLIVMYRSARRLSRWEKAWAGWQAEGFALMATALMAFSAYQIDHAQDARPYTLLLLIALLAVDRMLAIVQSQQENGRASLWQWLILAVLLAAGLYTQYFFSVFASFVVLYLAWNGRSQRGFLLQLAGMLLVVGLLLMPWLPYFQAQMLFLKQAGHYTAGLWNPIRLPEKLWRSACEFFLPESKVGKLIPLLILLSALLVAGLQRFGKQQQKAQKLVNSPVLALLLFWLVAVIGGQVLLDVLKHSHTATIRRYLLLASPACALLLSYALISIAQYKAIWTRWLAGGLVVLMLGLMWGDTAERLFKKHTSSDEFKLVAAWINPQYQGGDVLLVNRSGAMAVGMAYYLKPDVLMWGLDIPKPAALSAKGPLMERLQQVVSPHERVWLVFSHAAPSTIRRLTQWLQGQGFALTQQENVPGVDAMLWVRSTKLHPPS